MQTVTTEFNTYAQSSLRPLSWHFTAAFDRTYNSTIDFFTLDTSQLDIGLLAPSDNNSITEWDKYNYRDYSDRVISLEWTREEEPFASTVMAFADITLDNHDHLFTANSFILPYRPVKIQAGFAGTNIPCFVGLTDGMPQPDEKNGTVKLHCIDFLYSIFNKGLSQSYIYQDQRTDEIISDLLLNEVGLLSNQFNLDTALNRINIVYFEKDEKLSTAINKLMEAEQGRFYLDETGIIQFKSRQNYVSQDVYHFDRSSIIDATVPKEDDVINVVEVKSNVRTVQPLGSIGTLTQAQPISAGGSVDVWIDFNDPVVSAVDPVAIGSSVSSYFQSNTESDNSGTSLDANITVTSTYVFAKSMKITYSNSSALAGYITKTEIFGEAAVNISPIYVRVIDQDSIDKYDEKVKTIDNEFFTDAASAESKATILVDDYSEYGDIFDITVKGNPALQIGDSIGVGVRESTSYKNGDFTNLGIIGEDYKITKIESILDGSFIQKLRIKHITRRNYFTLNQDQLDNSSIVLAP